MKRASLLGVLVLISIMAFGSVASAGEMKGPPGEDGAQGGATPIADFWTGDGAASLCSFSGLNDIIDDTEPTLTQSYGTFLVLVRKTAGVSVHEAKEILGESPADSCNPNRAPFGNPKK